MARSLKSLYGPLSSLLGESEDALYGKQRAFVFAGILDSKGGRGPGSGVTASPHTLAQFLIALVTNAAASVENAALAKALARANRAAACPLTRETKFIDALACVLSDNRISARLDEVQFHLTEAKAVLLYDGSQSEIAFGGKAAKQTRQPERSTFETGGKSASGLKIQIALPGDDVRALAKILRDAE